MKVQIDNFSRLRCFIYNEIDYLIKVAQSPKELHIRPGLLQSVEETPIASSETILYRNRLKIREQDNLYTEYVDGLLETGYGNAVDIEVFILYLEMGCELDEIEARYQTLFNENLQLIFNNMRSVVNDINNPNYYSDVREVFENFVLLIDRNIFFNKFLEGEFTSQELHTYVSCTEEFVDLSMRPEGAYVDGYTRLRNYVNNNFFKITGICKKLTGDLVELHVEALNIILGFLQIPDVLLHPTILSVGRDLDEMDVEPLGENDQMVGG